MSEPTTQVAQANEVTEAVEQTKAPTSITNGASPASEQPVASSSKPKKHASSKPPRAGPSPDVLISKALAYLLRHGAVKEKLPIRGDGYIPLDAVLEKARLRQIDMITDPTDCTKNGKKKVRKPSADDVKRVVDTPGDKKRFELTADENGQTLIRAMQGHSIVAVTELDHTPITLDTLSILAYDNEVPTVQGQLPQGVETLHGTTLAVWHQIEQEREGLKKMKRNHVHLARGRPRDDNDDSGMRRNSPVLIHIDIIQALKDGFRFDLAPNKAILTPGEGEQGILPFRYITKVEARNGNIIWEREATS